MGSLTGLIPGLHINTINQILLNLRTSDALVLSIIIIAMSLTHTFLDAIPSIFLGVPESDSIILLPGHKLVKEGKGLLAVNLTLIGSFFSVLFVVLLAPLLFFYVSFLYFTTKLFIFPILLFFVYLNIKLSENKLNALIITILSGLLGLLALNLKNSLFPLLTGLFGLSTILFSFSSKIPEQKPEPVNLKSNDLAKCSLLSIITGSLTGTLPGVSTSQSSMLAMTLLNKESIEKYLIISGGINTINFLISLFVFYLYQKSRNGSIIVVKEILSKMTLNNLLLFLLISLFTASIAYFLGKFLQVLFLKIITKINYSLITFALASFLLILTFLFSGILGFLILIASTSLGVLALRLKVSKRVLMNVILIPVLLYFF